MWIWRPEHFLPKLMPWLLHESKFCPRLTVHDLAFLRLRKKLSSHLTSLARCSQQEHGRRHSMDTCIHAGPVSLGSWLKTSLGARGCIGTHVSEEARPGHARLDSSPDTLVPQGSSKSLPRPQQQVLRTHWLGYPTALSITQGGGQQLFLLPSCNESS